MKKSLITLAALVALSVHAGPPKPPTTPTTGGNSASASSHAAAAARASAIAAQRQAQGQQQTARGGNATGGSAQGGMSGGNTLATSTNVEGDKITIAGDAAQGRNPVATAYAAPLTATNGTCMGSTTAGAQGANLGLSFGTTWADSSCDIRYDAAALAAAGLAKAAIARLCQKADIEKAMEAAGTPCPSAPQKRAAIGGGSSDITAQAVTCSTASDPIVRDRLCKQGK